MLWNLKRLLISAFVLLHLGAVATWILPACPLKFRYQGFTALYLMPIAQWQYWGMFSPEPVRDTVTLEAVALDNNGMLHSYAFPREADYSLLGASLHYRHSKYSANFAIKDEFKAHREFAARHVVRQLHLSREAFPVQVQLMFQVKPCPPAGALPDPMAPLTPSVIDTYRFPALEEVQP